MILSDRDIKKKLLERKIMISPLDLSSVESASVDLHLGRSFLTVDVDAPAISMKSPVTYRETVTDKFIIPAKSFVLARTEEYIRLPDNLAAFVEGRSSIGRLGLFVQNAGWVDPGFEGTITLELYNANSMPIILEAGRRICQIVFAKTQSKADKPYRGKYQGQVNAQGSLIYKDRER